MHVKQHEIEIRKLSSLCGPIKTLIYSNIYPNVSNSMLKLIEIESTNFEMIFLMNTYFMLLSKNNN